ncbi:MAG: hypothetical protein RLZZ301_645 [Bacteroidota bacterium]|jgi:hypothetical protein
MLKNTITQLTLLFLTPFYWAQTVAPKYSNEFLTLGVGAESMGMGSAFVASSSGVHAAYWNPAALTSQQRLEASLMHASYFGGIASYDYLGVSKRIDAKSVAALSLLRFGVDNILNTSQLIDNNGQLDYNQISTFTAGDYALLLSYGRQTKWPSWSIGGSGKLIYRHIGNFARGMGFGFDLGLRYKPTNHFQAAAVLRDATSTFNVWTYNLSPEMQQTFLNTGNELPQNGLELTLPKLLLGAAGSVKVGAKGLRLGGELDVDLSTDGQRNVLLKTKLISLDPHAGAYLNYKQLVSVRIGISNIQQFTDFDHSTHWGLQPHLGMGLQLKNWKIDYAFTRLGASGSSYYTHLLSLHWAFGAVIGKANH